MSLIAPFIKTITAYDSTEWEVFIREWAVSQKSKYHEVRRFGGPNDMGRDVVGFADTQKFDGVWDNFQCKHYATLLQPAVAIVDIAKIIYYSQNGYFKPPRCSFFVAPRGPSTSLRDLLGSPSKLKEYVSRQWDIACANAITEKRSVLFVGDLRDYIESFDFGIFGWYSPDELLDDFRTTAFYAERFGGLLPAPKKGVVPAEVTEVESRYIRELLNAYGEKLGRELADLESLGGETDLQSDLARQRERFFDAEAFAHTYRDQTEPGTVEDFVGQMHHAIDPVVCARHENGFERLCQTLRHAATIVPASILSQQAKPQIKQGVCHQLANQALIRWVKR